MSDVTVNYNGSSITEMSSSGSKTLKTKGTFLTDDITINYSDPLDTSAVVPIPVLSDKGKYLRSNDETGDIEWDDMTVDDGTITREKLDNNLKAATDAVPGIANLMLNIFPNPYPYTYYDGRYVYWNTGVKKDSEGFSCTNFIPLNGAKRILYSRLKVESSSPNHGIAFFSSNATSAYISGIRSISGASEAGYEMYEAVVPENATHVQITWVNEARREQLGDLKLYDADQYNAALDIREQKLDDRVTVLENSEDREANYHALNSEVIQSAGVQAAVLRARQFSDIAWTPVADMPGIKKNKSTGVYDYVTFKKGVRQKGIPYSRVDDGKRVGDAVSFDCFATAVMNPNSYLYVTNIYDASQKRATAYGVVCSKLVEYAWGCPQLHASQQIEKLPGIVKIADPGEWDENDIKVGDGVLNPQVHCSICTDVLRDNNDVVRAIEITEAVTPTCRRLTWGIKEFFETFGSYGLYRYQYIDDAEYNKAEYVDIDDGITGPKDIPIAIRRGSFTIIPKNGSRTADVDNTKWTTMHVLHNGTETTSAISAATLIVPTSDSGYYEIWPTDAQNNRGNSSFYYVEDTPTITKSVSGSTLTLTYSADCPGWYVYWNNAGNNLYTLLSGTGSDSVTIPANATSFKIAFKSKYGVWWSSSISLS